MYSVILYKSRRSIGRSSSLLACRVLQALNGGSVVIEEHASYDKLVDDTQVFNGPSFMFSQFVARVDIYLSRLVVKE